MSQWGAARSDDEITALLSRQRAGDAAGAGLIVGLVDAHGRRIVGAAASAGDTTSSDADALFGTALVTMPFTALLLADLVRHGRMAWSDPISMHLPAHVIVPQRHGRSMTLLDLAAHRSGLPALPPGLMKATDPGRPLAAFTIESLYAFLASYELPRDIDARTEISLVGYALLGQALSYTAGEDFSALLRRGVLDPLEMGQTRLAEDGPYDSAVGLRSTVRELLQFLSAMLGHTASPLAATIRELRRLRDVAGREHPIGWMTFSVDGVFTPGGRDILWTEGMAGGDRSFVGFSPRDGMGVVAAAIGSLRPIGLGGLNAVQNLGLHLLEPRWPANDSPVPT
jgi:CubicO group peptidase (beta-lactamase class C family)